MGSLLGFAICSKPGTSTGLSLPTTYGGEQVSEVVGRESPVEVPGLEQMAKPNSEAATPDEAPDNVGKEITYGGEQVSEVVGRGSPVEVPGLEQMAKPSSEAAV